MLLYVTGDLHGDLTRFKEKPLLKLKKGDTLLVCGDFGFVWDGGKKEQKALKWLETRPFTILFVDGCNENFDLLERYSVTEWNGGKVRVLADNVMQLMRGEIFTVEDKKFFAFGGGDASDSIGLQDEFSTSGKEQPTVKETSTGISHLEANGDTIDFIITHDAPAKIKQFMNIEDNNISFINNYLDIISQICKFKTWYFGKYHKNKFIPPYYHNVFTELLKIE